MRRLYWLIPLIALILLTAFFPSLASTSLGKPLLIRALENRLQGTVSIETVRLSWFGPQRFEKIAFSNPQIAGSAEAVLSNAPLWSLSDLGESFQLKNGSFSFPSYGGGRIEHVDAQIEGSEIAATGNTDQGGSLSVKGKIYSRDDFDVVARLKSVPVGALDQLAHADGLLYQILGPTLDLNGAVVYNRGEGSLSLDVSSTNVQTILAASLTENAFALKEPLTATLRLTSELGASLMREINPLFLTGLEAKNPIILRVSPKNFSFPLPFSLQKLKIGNATLDMGQVRARTGKSLRSLLALLKKERIGSEVDLWFTPVAFKVENGLIETGRMDALIAGDIHICTWGDIDLVRDRLQMVLGLPAETLAQSFQIQNLPRSYVMKIPIRGSTKDPEFETGPAAAKIAAMAAAQQIPKAGGKAGKAFGGLLNLFSQAKEDEDAPPPNRPFPWEK